jgi:hypothetical protein
MKKRMYLLLLTALVCLLLASCGCKHEWAEATCDVPKTCTLCGETEGEPLQHQWKDATCLEPKTCTLCNKTEGDPLGHAFADSAPDCENPKKCVACGIPETEAIPHTWVDATCDNPKTCSVCHKTEGEKLEHIWQEATCEAPKTCTLCGLTEGAPTGHSWLAATCAAPKTCENCGKTEGEAKEHTWVDATCVAPKMCTTCYATEGEALGHDWTEATTYAPKTCKVCGMTDGDKLDVDSRFQTGVCKFLFGKWKSHVTESIESGGRTYSIEYWCYYEFEKDGTVTTYVEVDDEDEFLADYAKIMEIILYDTLAQQGINKTQADKLFRDQYGMTIQQYSLEIAKEVLTTMLEPQRMVYYVENKTIYFAETWKSEFEGVGYRKVGEKVHLDNGEVLSPVD